MAGSAVGATLRRAELHFPEIAEHIMGMPALSRRWTAADVRALMDESRHWPRYELLDGELLVTPAPNGPHQFAVTGLVRRLGEYCARERVGMALVSPADIVLAPETIMQPDVFVVPEGLISSEHEPRWADYHWLLLAVEVLSPSTGRQDRIRKRDFYLANGVREYWIVDTDARFLERWTPERDRPDVRRDFLEWHPAGAATRFTLDVQEFFTSDVRLPRRL